MDKLHELRLIDPIKKLVMVEKKTDSWNMSWNATLAKTSSEHKKT